MSISFLKKYAERVSGQGKPDLASSIVKTSEKFCSGYLNSFSFAEHSIGLLFGNVQAGKTAQMFGIMCSAADESFRIFILLTTDNVALQTQTLERVRLDLEPCGFCVCGEADKQKFIDNALANPAVIVLKKNTSVLLQWYNTLASSSFVMGNALFIVDDEADAASLNTLVNKDRVSTINSRLANIRDSSVGSIYLQVTGTPQALLLQSSYSDFRPAFTCYFEPGQAYLGGDFFFGGLGKPGPIRYIEDCSGDALYQAVIHHLAASAQLLLSGEKVCNFVVHPGIKKSSHTAAKTRIEKILHDIECRLQEFEFRDALLEEYKISEPARHENAPFEDVYRCVQSLISGKQIKVLLMNGDTNVTDEEYNNGSNIIIGGNVLGRGVTFAKLQTLYYTRTAKKPQADTMWQHSRMFGYDRDPGLMSVYLTHNLYTLFSNINAGNNSIISQVEKGIEKIQIYYPEGLNPTRKNVVDLKMVDFISGGANYYPDNPENDSVEELTSLLMPFASEGYYQVSPKLLLSVLSRITFSEDLNRDAFANVIKAKLAENPADQGILIVRRGREVTQGTGSLLSPNDRDLGARFPDKTVLTLYQISGKHGWKQDDIWVPNIKLPDFMNYYDVH